MRKFIAIIASLLAFTFFVAACGDDDGEPATTGQETDVTEPMDDDMDEPMDDDMDDEMDEPMDDEME